MNKEHYKVAGRSANSRIRVSLLKYYDGEKVQNMWDPEKIQQIIANEYRIESIIWRRRGTNNKL